MPITLPPTCCISVNCVVLGFDSKKLNVLLEQREYIIDDKKVVDHMLPGGMMTDNEDLDEAATRLLHEKAGMRNLKMFQFKAYGSRSRIKGRNDIEWMKQQLGVEIVNPLTIGYASVGKIGRKLNLHNAPKGISWFPVEEALKMPLAFDHAILIQDAIKMLQYSIENDPIIVFNLMPLKFTALQLRTLYECIYRKELDVRNFKKKMKQYEYVVPLEEVEQGVAHRAARYYRFDRVKYKKYRRGMD